MPEDFGSIDDLLDSEVIKPLARGLETHRFKPYYHRIFMRKLGRDFKIAASEGRRLNERGDIKGFLLERWVNGVWSMSVNGYLNRIAGEGYERNGVQVAPSDLGNVLMRQNGEKGTEVELDGLFEINSEEGARGVIVEVSFGNISHERKVHIVEQLYDGRRPYMINVRPKAVPSANVSRGPIEQSKTITFPGTKHFEKLAEMIAANGADAILSGRYSK